MDFIIILELINNFKRKFEGLVCSAACLQGEVNWHLNTQNERNVKNGAKGYEGAKAVALEYKEILKMIFI